MKVSRLILIAALILAGSSGCIHQLNLSPTPAIRNPVVNVASDPSYPSVGSHQ